MAGCCDWRKAITSVLIRSTTWILIIFYEQLFSINYPHYRTHHGPEHDWKHLIPSLAHCPWCTDTQLMTVFNYVTETRTKVRWVFHLAKTNSLHSRISSSSSHLSSRSDHHHHQAYLRAFGILTRTAQRICAILKKASKLRCFQNKIAFNSQLDYCPETAPGRWVLEMDGKTCEKVPSNAASSHIKANLRSTLHRAAINCRFQSVKLNWIPRKMIPQSRAAIRLLSVCQHNSVGWWVLKGAFQGRAHILIRWLFKQIFSQPVIQLFWWSVFIKLAFS